MLSRLAKYGFGFGTLFLLALGSTSSASAQNPVPDITIRVSGDRLRTIIENAANDSIMARPYLRWDSGTRVEMEGSHVRVNLLLDTSNAAAELAGELPSGTPDILEIDVEFDLSVYCVAAIPELRITSSEVQVNLQLPWFLDILLGPFGIVFVEVAEVIVDQAANIPAQITENLREELRNQFDGIDEIPSCPHSSWASDGSLTLEFGGPNSCVDGATRRDGCGSAGTGFAEWRCINGQWVLEDFGCH